MEATAITVGWGFSMLPEEYATSSGTICVTCDP